MPDKEGSDDEKKSTKSVVNKKQKQMMGEEGYDVARDMGRVKPSKDKKDATTMPPSKEMEKTRKVNKGPSALERVKKKYKGQIMKMEELDLTQVAKAFGGYIVEETQEEKKKREEANKIKTTSKPARVQGRQDATNPKEGGHSHVDLVDDDDYKKAKTMGTPTKTIGKMKTYKVDPKSLKNNPTGKKEAPKTSKPKKVVKKVVPSAAADALKDIEKDTGVMGKTMPGIKQDVKTTVTQAEKQSRPKLSKFSGPQMSVAQKSKTFKQSFGTPTGADPQTGKPTYMRSGVLTKSGKLKPARRYKLSPEKQAERLAKVKAKIDRENPTYIGKSGKPLPVPREEPGMKGFKGFKKRTQRSITKTGKQVAKVTAPVTAPVKAFAKASPLGATIAGIEVAKITPGLKRFFMVKPPLPPKPKGGKVGRRTAG